MGRSLAERLMSRVAIELGGCWMWTGSTRKDGYGQIWTSIDADGNRRLLSTHRASFELAYGPIPDSLVLDHLCRRPLCVNPEHLEAVTQRINVLRGEGPTARNARKTTCPDGHPFDGLYASGQRRCTTCDPIGGRVLSLRCQVCGSAFVSRKRNAVTCSGRCRTRKSKLQRAG